METTSALDRAVDAYINRKHRSSHPDGTFDKRSRWYPSDAEFQRCCAAVRTPSAAWPYSLMTHCRSVKHIAALYGVEATDLRTRARTAKEG